MPDLCGSFTLYALELLSYQIYEPVCIQYISRFLTIRFRTLLGNFGIIIVIVIVIVFPTFMCFYIYFYNFL